MQHLTIYRPSTPEAVAIFAEKRGLTEHLQRLPKDYQYPQEDAYYVSDTAEAAIVADGVTLNFNEIIRRGETYPDPSPAGTLAQLFCEQAAQALTHNDVNISEAFFIANQAVADCNSGFSPGPLANNPTGLFAATTACASVRNDRLFAASLCDAFVMHFDNAMCLKKRTTGQCKPYAVINGDQAMLQQLEYFEADIVPGDRVFVCTDGFEYYVQENNFLSLFLHWDDTLASQIDSYMRAANLRDPSRFGHERTLVAILI